MNQLVLDESTTASPPVGIVIISPPAGTVAGGETITVNGQYFESTTSTTVDFINTETKKSTPGTNVQVLDNGRQLTVTQPPLAQGQYQVSVTTDQGTGTSSGLFSVGVIVNYISPNFGPIEGGTKVTITGVNLSKATAVNFGRTSVTAITNNTDSSLTVVSPALAMGSYDIMVVAAAGTSPTSSSLQFTAGASVYGISPSFGSSTSTTDITITGADLTGATAVNFGSTQVTTGINVNADGTSLTVTAPSKLSTGVVDVTVTTSKYGTSLPSTKSQFLVDPLTLSIQNNTGLGDSVPIYAVVYGYLAFDTSGNLDQHPTPTSLGSDKLVQVYFNEDGQYTITAPLYNATQENAVPSYELSFNGSNETNIILPNIFIKTARIYLAVNEQLQLMIDDPLGLVSAPNLSSASDPNHKIFYDFIEFTLNESNQLYINTSQVDQVGFPFKVTVDPSDPHVPNGVGVLVSRGDMFGPSADGFSSYLQSMNASVFSVLTSSEGSGTINGTLYPYRIIAPANLLVLDPTNKSLSTYFDNELNTLFTNTSRKDLTLQVPNPNVGQRGPNNKVNPGDSSVSMYTFNGTVTNNTLQFKTTINATTNPTDVTLTVYQPKKGGTTMVFACNGNFADNVARYGSPKDSLISLKALKSSLLGNIENQVVSALNRGVANSPIANWTDATKFYQPNSTSNFYAGYLHANISGSDVSQDQLAYGFAFDDQGSKSTTQVSTNPKSASVKLESW